LSFIKLLIIRDPYCPAVRLRATRVIENTTDVIVIIEPDIVQRISLYPSIHQENILVSQESFGIEIIESMKIDTIARKIPQKIRRRGVSQKLQKRNSFIIIIFAFINLLL